MTANANILIGVMNRNRLTTSIASAFDSSATVSELSDDSSFACTHCCFTDGSARDVQEKRLCAGWSFTSMTVHPRHGDQPREEVCGPVQISENTEFYVSATHAANNMMQGLIEALFWLNTCVEQRVLQAYSAVMMTVSSPCVKGLIEYTFVTRDTGARHTATPHSLKTWPHGPHCALKLCVSCGLPEVIWNQRTLSRFWEQSPRQSQQQPSSVVR